MDPIITYQIPAQNYELVRDRIGEILLLELLNQYTYNHDESLKPTGVDIERFTPIDDGDFPRVVVSLDKGKYARETKDYDGNVTGEYYYYIDIYTGAASTSEDNGDQVATLALQKLIGMCRVILDNPAYSTLGFDPKTSDTTIWNVRVDEFAINPTKRLLNASDYIAGSIRFCVTVPEKIQLLDTVPVKYASVTVKLYNSDRGYFWGPVSEIPTVTRTYVNALGDAYVTEDGLLTYVNVE